MAELFGYARPDLFKMPTLRQSTCSLHICGRRELPNLEILDSSRWDCRNFPDGQAPIKHPAGTTYGHYESSWRWKRLRPSIPCLEIQKVLVSIESSPSMRSSIVGGRPA